MIKKRSALFKLLFFSYLVILFSLMLITLKTEQMEIPKLLFGIEIDKVVHFILFFPYPFLIWFAFKIPLTKKFNHWIFPVIAISGLLLAVFTECVQSFNPNRNYDTNDILANVIAIIAGTLLLTVFKAGKKSLK